MNGVGAPGVSSGGGGGGSGSARCSITKLIVVSTAIFLAVGRPVTVLIAVGALNGLILPIGLAAMLIASRKTTLLNGYVHSRMLTAAGAVVALAMAALGAYAVGAELVRLVR